MRYAKVISVGHSPDPADYRTRVTCAAGDIDFHTRQRDLASEVAKLVTMAYMDGHMKGVSQTLNNRAKRLTRRTTK